MPVAMNFQQAALEQLDALYGYALALTHSQTEAEDLVQETYLRAMRAFGQLVPDSHLKGWLFTIMRNAWLNQQRHARSGPRFVEVEAEEEDRDPAFASVALNPYVVFVRNAEREQVRTAIARLPRAQREVIILRDIEGFNYQEIAVILACPVGTVMSRLGRAREQLRRLLEQWRPDGLPAM